MKLYYVYLIPLFRLRTLNMPIRNFNVKYTATNILESSYIKIEAHKQHQQEKR